MARYVFNQNTGRFRDLVTGRFVSEATVRSIIDDRIESGFKQLDAMLERLADGSISINEYQSAFLLELRNLHTQTFLVGAGGRNNVDASDYGLLGAKLRSEYAYARGLVDDIANGRVSIAEARRRLKMYANSVWNSFSLGLERQALHRGLTQMRRRLTPAEHCVDCVEYASQGWQPIGSLPLPGEESQCLSNCRCEVEYR